MTSYANAIAAAATAESEATTTPSIIHNGIQFERPIGAFADTKELEFVAALHQMSRRGKAKDGETAPLLPLRQDGTLIAKDIQSYLISRHGIQVTMAMIKEHLLLDLCGSESNVPASNNKTNNKKAAPTPASNPHMDLCQLTALLMIPLLRQEEDENNNNTNQEDTTTIQSKLTKKRPTQKVSKGLVEHILLLIMDELEHHYYDIATFQELNDNFETATRLTPKLIQAMFRVYGEIVQDEIVEEMMALAKESTEDDADKKIFWTPATFLRALTGDVQQYNTTNITTTPTTADNPPTTHYQDAFASSNNTTTTSQRQRQPRASAIPFESPNIMPSLDQAAETYRSPAWTILLYVTFVWNYALYLGNAYWFDFDDKCNDDDEGANQFPCQVAAAVVNMTLHFVQIGICGLLYIGIGSLGNDSSNIEPGGPKVVAALGVFMAMCMVVLFSILPVFLEDDTFIWDTTKDSDIEYMEVLYWMGFLLGFLLLVLQFIRLCDILFGGCCSSLGVGGRTRMEHSAKQAAQHKTRLMVEHAMLLHCPPAFPGQKQQRGQRLFGPKHGVSKRVISASDQLHKRGHGHKDNANNNATTATTGTTGTTTTEELAIDWYTQSLRAQAKKDKTELLPPTCQLKSLLHYQACQDLTEPAGGILWAYGRLFNGALFQDEGVWIPVRVMAANVAQWIVVVLSLLTLFALLNRLDEELEDQGSVEIARRRLLLLEQQQQQKQEHHVQRSHHYHPHPHLPPPSKTGHHLSSTKNDNTHNNDYLPPNQQKQQHLQRRHRKLQTPGDVVVDRFNDTHYTDGNGVYPNILFDHNRSHFTDGTPTGVWDFATFSHNGTHVFDRYYNYNQTHFTDGLNLYAYDEYATNGTHISNGNYLFDGTIVTTIQPGAGHVNNVESWEYRTALSVGCVAALLATIGIAVVYIPSFVSTVLKYRSGVYESLKGGAGHEQFRELRNNPDHSTTVLGNALWGSVLTATVCWILAGGIVFLSVWSETRDDVLGFYALVAGVLAVILLKYLMVKIFRGVYGSHFYRKRPAMVNVLNVLFEAWHLALAAGYMLIRSIKLLGVAAIYIGRVDVTMFAPGVGYLGPYAVDSDHFSFKKDLLIHEAHRHPYLERLGTLYLMKLHHGSEFGTRAGAYWRLLFVLALMPWMRAYRVRPSEKQKRDTFEDEGDDDTTSYAGSEMTPYGLQLELDITQMANDSLTKRNKDLKGALDTTKQKLREATRNSKILERKLQRAQEKAEKNKAKAGGAKESTKAKQQASSSAKKSQEPARKPQAKSSQRSKPTLQTRASAAPTAASVQPKPVQMKLSLGEASSEFSGSSESESASSQSDATEKTGTNVRSGSSGQENSSPSSSSSGGAGGGGGGMPMPQNVGEILDRPFASRGDFNVTMEGPSSGSSGQDSRSASSSQSSPSSTRGGGMPMPQNVDEVLDHPFASRGNLNVTIEEPSSGGASEDFEAKANSSADTSASGSRGESAPQSVQSEDFESESDESSDNASMGSHARYFAEMQRKREAGELGGESEGSEESDFEDEEEEGDESFTSSSYDPPPASVPGPGAKLQSNVSGLTYLESHHSTQQQKPR